MTEEIKKEITPELEQAKDNFIQGAGHISASLVGMLNRVCGQIYALLFLSKEPLSLDDIVEELKVSKGNVSINIRILEDYKLVKKVWVKGSRKDYYQALDELPTKVIKEFFDKIKRNIQDSLDMIQDSCDFVKQVKKTKDTETAHILERLERVQSFFQAANFLFESLYTGQKIDTSLLKPILND